MTIIDQIKSVQRAIGATPDGRAGPETWSKLFDRLCASQAGVSSSLPPPSAPVDARSEAAIATLLDPVKPYARALVHVAANRGLVIRVISGTRSYAEQDALFAHGRTTSGPILTNARGGQSNHNFGIAFDVCLFDGGTPVYESPVYREIGAAGKCLGLEWGGDWASIQDEPHFELRPAWAAGLGEATMLAGLRERHAAGVDPFTA